MKSQLKAAAAITAAAMLVALFLLSFWMVLQVFAPKITDYAATLTAAPDLLLILAVFVGGTYVIKNILD